MAEWIEENEASNLDKTSQDEDNEGSEENWSKKAKVLALLRSPESVSG